MSCFILHLCALVEQIESMKDNLKWDQVYSGEAGYQRQKSHGKVMGWEQYCMDVI